MSKRIFLPCLDSTKSASQLKRDLSLDHDYATSLGHSALKISRHGSYLNGNDQKIDINTFVNNAIRHKKSIPPDFTLPVSKLHFDETTIQVSNETTLQAGYRLSGHTSKVLALNFANGKYPGGGFLNGARAQEECLCRSSSLYVTLENDPMYTEHAKRPFPDSTNWAILSPDVPVFRQDNGTMLDKPFLLSFLTCAAPKALAVGQTRAAQLMNSRIHRILEIAHAYDFDSLVLGAWGCGAFKNDPETTARQFRHALLGDFAGSFKEIVFAIADWSTNRRLLGVFRDMFRE